MMHFTNYREQQYWLKYIQQCIDREYQNLFYMSKDLQVVDVHRQVNNKINREEKTISTWDLR